jgi:hypothetical protein
MVVQYRYRFPFFLLHDDLTLGVLDRTKL